MARGDIRGQRCIPIGSQVDIKRVWLLPPPGFRSPSAAKPIERLERIDRTVIGQSTFVSYGFDDRWELVPGPWILEFWYKGQKIGSTALYRSGALSARRGSRRSSTRNRIPRRGTAFLRV